MLSIKQQITPMYLESAVTTPTSSSAGSLDGQPRILIVEDERHIGRFLQHVLSKQGYRVVVEYDAEGAWNTAKSFAPDAWIIDMVLPGMSGLDLLQKIRNEQNSDRIVTIILSGHWFGQCDENQHATGASAQCAKPIAPATLIRKLHDLGIVSSSTSRS